MNISQNTQILFICSFSFRYSTPEPVAKTAIFFLKFVILFRYICYSDAIAGIVEQCLMKNLEALLVKWSNYWRSECYWNVSAACHSIHLALSPVPLSSVYLTSSCDKISRALFTSTLTQNAKGRETLGMILWELVSGVTCSYIYLHQVKDSCTLCFNVQGNP